jgi:Leucine-rich repeat (LRR) protein
LESCGLEWRAKARSIFECTTLRKLFINCYDQKNLSAFTPLVNLETLSILNAPIENLAGLECLSSLRKLRLGNLRNLKALDGIEQLQNLERLDIDGCRSIRNIEAIGPLAKLRRLHLIDDGKIDSLAPLSKMENLIAVTFPGSTNIVDGDLSPLARHRLSAISFQNRRHYTHRREDFDGYKNFSVTSVSPW